MQAQEVNGIDQAQYTHEQLLTIIQACFKTQVISFDDYALVILKKKPQDSVEVIAEKSAE
jgi:hypothetical protein